MSRSCPIARLTVDRPQNKWDVGCTIPEWLRAIASQVEDWNIHHQTDGPRCLDLRRRYYAKYARNQRTKYLVNLRVHAAGALSLTTRKRIAKWLRSRAAHIESENAVFEGRWFTQVFSLA